MALDLDLTSGHTIQKNISSFIHSNKYTQRFKPGVVVRYTPGVHELSVDDYQLMCIPNKTYHADYGQSHNTFYGNHNLCWAHLFAIHLRINQFGYDLEKSCKRMRDCDKSNYLIANAVKNFSIFEETPPLLNKIQEIVYLTPNKKYIKESNGLAIYAPPGNGKSYCQNKYFCSHVDTDFIYDPDFVTLTKLANYGMTIFTNNYELVVKHVPTVMFLPSDDIMRSRIRKQVQVSDKQIDKWITDLREFINRIIDDRQTIEVEGKCVIIVRSTDPTVFLNSVMGSLLH